MMKKNLILVLVCLWGIMQLPAQQHRVQSNDSQHITLSVLVGDLQVNDVQWGNQTFSQVTLNDAVQMVDNVGAPQLPMITKMIEIPMCGDIHVTATAGSVRTFSASEAGLTHTVLPTQIQYPKSYTGEREFVKDETVYSTNAAYGFDLATITKVGIARDVNLAAINIYPVKVNPVSNEVTVYDDITITVTYDDADMAATRELKMKYGSVEFGRPAQMVNAIEFEGTRDAISTTPIKYVIIANSMFEGQLDDFADWKRRKGFLVEIAYTDTIGTTTTQIKSYITSLFNNATATNPAPTFVLLVGDNEQIPAFAGQTDSHITDLYYFTQVGNDNIPDCYWGRFSAQTVAQLTPQIDKTLVYEQLTMPDPSYLDRCVLVAGKDNGTSGDYGYSHANPVMHYFEDTYAPVFFTTTDAYYNPHNNDDATIRTKLSAGTGYANYSAHCSPSGWYSPSFTTSHISSMSNTGKFGLMVGNCCQSNQFNDSECFGEALLRATNKGAVGYIGGTNSTLWYHDYYWAVGARSNVTDNCSNCNTVTYNANNLGAYDCMCHTHNESYSNWYVTQGSMNYIGDMAVQTAFGGASGSYVRYYWEIYELMGDPSVMPWFGQPSDMNVRVNNVAPLNGVVELSAGETTFTVSTGAPYSYIALTHNLTLITAALSDANGNATLTFPELEAGEAYELAASAQNYKTTFTTLNVTAAEGAHVVITNVEVANNTAATAGAHLLLNVTIRNSYPDAATNTVISATTTSSQITLTDASENVGTVNSGTNQTLNGSFALNVSSNIADGDIAPIHFTVNFLSNGAPESTTFDFDVNLVDAHINYVSNSYTITSGNGDNTIDPGETVTITIVDENDGHATANNVVSQLSTYYNLTPVTNGNVNIGTLNAQSQCTSTFTVSIGSTVPNGTMIPFFHHIYSTTNSALSRVDTVWLVVGSVLATETWEGGAHYDWTTGETYPWSIVSTGAYAGTYCAKSGNSNVNNSTSELQLTINVPADGEVSYYSKVSSENDYDFFKFYLDGVQKEQRSGTGNWQQSTWPVTAGTHTLRFTYEKDQSQKSGSDCAWVDNITFPAGGEIAPVPELLNDISSSVAVTAGNNDADVNPGETISVTITTENISSNPITNISSVLSTTSPYATISNPNQTIASIAPNGTANTTYLVNIAANTPDSTDISFEHVLSIPDLTTTPYTVTVHVFEVATPNLVKVSDSYVINGGNGDNVIDPGETVVLTIVDENTGRAAAPSVVSQLSTYYNLAPVSNGTLTLGTVAALSQCSSDFTITVGNDVPVGTMIPYVHHIYSTTNANADRTDTVWLTVGSTEALEDWESGDFTQFEWTNQSTYPWVVVNDANEAFAGNYYAKSGNAGHGNSNSDLELSIESIDGEISFYSKVASERNYDFFKFYIDGVQKYSTSGGVQQSGSSWNATYTDTCTWQYHSFPITAGTHTIKFSFTKDNTTNAGSDCAKIDNIRWPMNGGQVAPVPAGIVITSAGLNANSNGYEAENVNFDVTLSNNSTETINNVALTLTTTSADITLTDATETIASMVANSTVSFSSVFAGAISNNVADGTVVNCIVTADFMLSGNATQQTCNFSFAVHSGIVDDVNHSFTITNGNGDNEINPGETVEVVITTNNTGVTALNNVNSTLSTLSQYANISNAAQTITTIAANGSATTTYVIQIDAATPDNTDIAFTHTADAGIHGSDSYTFSLNVRTEAVVELEDVNYTQSIISGNSDYDVNPGETVRFAVYTRNNGRADAHNAVSILTADSPFANISNAAQNIGTIAGYATVNSQFDVAIDAVTPNQTTINFTHMMVSDEDTSTMTFSILVVTEPGEANLVEVSHSISITLGNDDANINPGENIKVTVYSRNEGTGAAVDVASTLMSTSAYASIANPVINYESVAAGATTTSQYNVAIDASTPDNTVIPFTHMITDGNHTATFNFNVTVVVDHTGIQENGENALIAIYPNPTSGNITIDLGSAVATDAVVFDVYGKKVAETSLNTTFNTISLQDCATGLYFVRILNQNEIIATAKIVKK